MTQKNPPVSLNYKKIFGKLPVKSFIAKLADGRRWFALKITNSGEIYGFTDAIKGSLSVILSYNLYTGKYKTLYTIPDKFQPEFLQVSNNFIFMTAYNSDDYTGKDEVLLYNRKTHKAKILNIRSSNGSVNDDEIALGDTFALWSSGVTGSNKKTIYKIFKYDFATEKTTVFKETAYMPVIGKDFIAYLAPERAGANNSSVYVYSLKDGSVKRITKRSIPSYLAVYGDKLVYSGYTNLDYYSYYQKGGKTIPKNELVVYENGKSRVLETATHDYEFVDVCGKYITWDENEKKRVYCFTSNKIAVLPTEYGSPLICDNFISWGEDAIKNESKEAASKEGMYLEKENIIDVSSK